MDLAALLLLGSLTLFPGIAFAATGGGESEGLKVESVYPHSVGALAGIEAGDELVSWSRATAATPEGVPAAMGRLDSPFDLFWVLFEQSPHGVVTIQGRRAGEEKAWTLAPGRAWGLIIRPALPAAALRLYEEALREKAAGRLEASLERMLGAAEILAAGGDVRNAAWLERVVAEKAAAVQRWEQSEEATERAVARLSAHGDLWEAVLLRRWSGVDRETALDWRCAFRRFQQAYNLAFHRLGPGLSEVQLEVGMGVAASSEGDLDGAEGYFLSALEGVESLAPGSLDQAAILVNLGYLARQQGDLEAADHWGREALALEEKLAPVDLETAISLTNLALLASQRGFLSDSEALLRRAYKIYEELLPGSPDIARNLGFQGALALNRGNLALAEEDLERSLAFYADQSLENYDFSGVLSTLADIAVQRGELASAQQYLTRALAARERLAPESAAVADTLLSLGRLAVTRGEAAAARGYLERALALRRKQREGSIHVAAILLALGGGEGVVAENASLALLSEAAAIFEREIPGSLAEADARIALGRRLARGREEQAALPHLERGWQIRRRLAPGSLAAAEALHEFGSVRQRLGHTAEAARDLCASVDLLDRQRLMFSGPVEARAYFESQIGPYYADCLRAQLREGEPAAAFATLERGRARALLAQLAERELRPAELPPELAAERWQLGAAYERSQEALARLSPERDAAAVERLLAELTQLRDRQASLATRLRKASPRAAVLEESPPIDLARARAALEPGTVLLDFSVGESDTLLFVVEAAGRPGSGLHVRWIPQGRKQLQARVEALRGLLQSPRLGEAKLRTVAGRLYRDLLGPTEALLRPAARILVCPDGPLHALPFAALRRRGGYLAAWKPLHFAPSATAYARLGRPPESTTATTEPLDTMVAFGDPRYSAGLSAGDAEVRSAVRRGLKLLPLPASRREAEEIAGLFPGGRAYLGAQATEEEVKRSAPHARFLHFACHGLLDERMPLNSGLALSIPEHPGAGEDNGILQAWEIYESLRLGAELVTLSACDTALGKDMGGEGILGLTRAFQFAGARSVLASLWSVADASTSTLMRSFYIHLRRGEKKDVALRAAQLALLHSGKPDLSHPFYWAAFQLYGSER